MRLDVRGTPIVEMWHASTLGLGRALPAALALQRFATTPEATQAISTGRAGAVSSQARPKVHVTLWQPSPPAEDDHDAPARPAVHRGDRPREGPAAEDAWNTRDPEKVAAAYTPDSQWRNRDEFFTGRDAIVAFLRGKWEREGDYALRKDLWAFTADRIAVRFQYESRDASGQWWRSYGNEQWEFDAEGYMRRREASINDVAIEESERRIFGPRPDAERGAPLRDHRSCRRAAAGPATAGIHQFALAEQLHQRRHEHHPHDRRVDEDRRRHADPEQLQEDRAAGDEGEEDGDHDRRRGGDHARGRGPGPRRRRVDVSPWRRYSSRTRESRKTS